MRNHTLIVVTLLILSHCQTLVAQEVAFCKSKVMFTSASENSGTNGMVLGEFNPKRGDGEACFSTRYFRLLKLYRDQHEDQDLDECGLHDLLVRSGDVCDPQYFWRSTCDSDLVQVTNKVNSMIAMPQPCIDGYDVYTDPRVFALNDTLVSLELQTVFIPWNEEFIEPVERWRLKQCIIQGWCDTTREARKEAMVAPKPNVFHEVDNMNNRHPLVLNRCDRCQEQIGSLKHHKNRPQLDGVGHYLAFVLDLRTATPYTLEQLAGENAREVIYEHILQFNADHPELRINEYHYRPEVRRHFIYAISSDHLILYTGDEGEFRAFYKIYIPWDAFGR